MLGTVVAGALGFVLVPVLLRGLGENAYGLWVLIGSLFTYAGILQFGLSSAINYQVPLALARGDDGALRRVISSGTAFFVIVSGVILVGTLVIRERFAGWFDAAPLQAGPARDAVTIVGALLAIAVSLQALVASLSGYQRYDLTSQARIGLLLVRAAVLFAAIGRGLDLIAVAWIYGLTELGIALLQTWHARRLLPAAVVRPAHVEWPLLRGMITYGSSTFLYTAGAVLSLKASEVVIGLWLGAAAVTRFSVACTGVLVLSAIVESLSAAIKPAVSDLSVREGEGRIRELALVAQKLALFIVVPGSAFFLIMGEEFVLIWTGLTDPVVAQAMAIVAVGQAFRLSQQANFLVLVGKGEHRVFGISVLALGVSVVVATALVVGPLGLGITGAAAVGTAAWVVVAGFVLPRHAAARLGISSGERLRRVYLPAFWATAPGLVVLALWKWLARPDGWLDLGLVVAGVAVATSVGAWSFGLAESERDRVRKLLPFRTN